MSEEYNVLQYPEGVERAEEKLLNLLPEDKDARDLFMNSVLQGLIQW